MLAALCLASVFAVSLSSYMTLCYTTLNVSNKNLGTSRGIELAEAGIQHNSIQWGIAHSKLVERSAGAVRVARDSKSRICSAGTALHRVHPINEHTSTHQ